MAKNRYKPVHFKIKTDDGRTAVCDRAIHQDYRDCRISAGIVTNLPPEDVYFMFERPHKEPTIFLLRRDEMLATAWVINGALWSEAMAMLDEKSKEAK